MFAFLLNTYLWNVNVIRNKALDIAQIIFSFAFQLQLLLFQHEEAPFIFPHGCFLDIFHV